MLNEIYYIENKPGENITVECFVRMAERLEGVGGEKGKLTMIERTIAIMF